MQVPLPLIAQLAGQLYVHMDETFDDGDSREKRAVAAATTIVEESIGAFLALPERIMTRYGDQIKESVATSPIAVPVPGMGMPGMGGYPR